ncbi:NTP transferase domain-containing protein [bacterium]|nr:NTP transferase domain-containing protein [bacterium]
MRFPVMLFAAGLGTRMGDLTRDRPKPLIPVAGKALLDHALDLCQPEVVESTVVNLHYLGHRIEDHLRGRNVALSWESTLLETGGGLRAALPLLGDRPVMTLNTDAVWTGGNPLAELAAGWRPDRMDALLLLTPLRDALGHRGTGDFLMDAEGRLQRAKGAAGLVYLGAQIIRTEALAEVPEQVFSLNRLWDGMIAKGRAYGVLHRGGWCDVGQPSSIALAEGLVNG